MDDNNKYIKFASNLQFYEFLQDEFKAPHFKIKNYEDEVSKLDNNIEWTAQSLSNFLRTHPKSFDIFEEIFQLSRFTNTQLTHFLFNVNSLDSINKGDLKAYLKYNIEQDNYFFKIYSNELKKNEVKNIDFSNPSRLAEAVDKQDNLFDSFIFVLKSAVSKYVSDCIKKRELIYKRLSSTDFKDASERTAKYFLENLKLNDFLKGINVKEFLTNKRRVIDTKSIHGKFGSIKIKRILEKHKISNADQVFNQLGIKKLTVGLAYPQLDQYKNKIIYLTERAVECIKKRKDNKLKKFDFVILKDLKPKILIETNFYSTAGTKIGINQGEYIDLKEDIEKNSNYLFIWITDGNYWLTSDGHSRFTNLYEHFGDLILNYSLFDKKLPELIR